MSVSLFDVQSGFGGMTPGEPTVFSAGDLLAEMDRLSIERALVRVVPDKVDVDVVLSNETLYKAHRDYPRLVPAPVFVPDGAYSYPSADEQVAAAVDGGAGAAFIRPARDCWTLHRWVSGRLLDALESHRMPLLCMQELVSLPEAAELAGQHKDLPIIVAGVGYREAHTLLGLLEAFPNVCLSIGNNFTYHFGIKAFVERVGPERLLFGTGLPATEAMPAITQLMYADISDAQKQMIGADNLDRLIGGIRR